MTETNIIDTVAERTGRTAAEIAKLKWAFDRVLDEHPMLSQYGFGFYAGWTAQQRQAELDRERADLRAAFPDVAVVYFWLQDNIRRNVTPSCSSYRIKHVAEDALGHYVSNGELIAAAILADYTMRKRWDSPNPLFGMRKRDVDAAIKRAVFA